MLTSAANPCLLAAMTIERDTLLTGNLRDVSRSFYLTLRVLPGSIRSQIGLAYLLARTTDTIADTQIVPVELRLQSLELLRARILGTQLGAVDFGGLLKHQGSDAERILLERVEESIALLGQFSVQDQGLIRRVLDTITSGQILDLQRFAGGSAQNLRCLNTDAELDDYTYRVAGCVGEFWTRMCLAHAFPPSAVAAGSNATTDADFETLGIHFGKGLQLVNILRDIPADLKNGRCYIPRERLAGTGLKPEDLLNPDPEVLTRFRPLYNELLDRADTHLRSGWEYTLRIPWRQVRVRLACAWPVLIGLQTLRLLRQRNVLDPAQRIKIRRADVRRTILRSLAWYPIPIAWRKLAE